MGLLGRTIFREAAAATFLGTVLFTFVLFLRSIGQIAELLVRSSAAPSTVAYLSALALPPTLVFTVPIGVLVGVLLAFSRMSSDGEITAMRAAGMPGLRVLGPVAALALTGTLLTAACSLWLTPWSIRETSAATAVLECCRSPTGLPTCSWCVFCATARKARLAKRPSRWPAAR